MFYSTSKSGDPIQLLCKKIFFKDRPFGNCKEYVTFSFYSLNHSSYQRDSDKRSSLLHAVSIKGIKIMVAGSGLACKY
jgi:hypothetical protein